ncbi:MAG: MltA domain-containing protein [Gammaproteobacteria bacterium]|nr:MltA domain-containing protein [Gammaproteobacteria bacterium]
MQKNLLIIVVLTLVLSACATRPPGIGNPVEWSKLQNWTSDNQSEMWQGFLKSCRKLSHEQWQEVCHLANNRQDLNDIEVREFFESHFEVRPVYAEDGESQGLITGYYEPLLKGSWQRSEVFRYPLYGVPKDLLIVDLGEIYPELKSMRLRGKLDGNRVVPYYDRAQLNDNEDLLQGTEILWVDSLVDVFFLHIQGSGRVQLTDGSTAAVGYAEQNGHPYQSIGKVLIEMGELERDQVTLFTIKDWLKSNPNRLNEVLSRNPSYIFFELRDGQADGPLGSLNVALTPRRSIAVDRSVIPLGAPVWLQTTLPDEQQSPLNTLMLAQDTGGAIKGHVRADVFWGRGDEAEKLAGLMKQQGKLFVLLPRGYLIKHNPGH